MKSNRYKAFTLAEMLITLGVIGVVAALTMPTLMNRSNDQAFVSKLQKVQSTLNQAHLNAERQHGMSQDWKFKDGSTDAVIKLYEYYKPFLNIAKDCGTDTGGGPGCFDPNWTMLNGSKSSSQTKYGLGGNVKAFQLKDGTAISIDGYTNVATAATFGAANHRTTGHMAIFTVDLNGKRKPNRAGKDIFFFVLGDNGIVPAGIDSTSDCKLSGVGYTCAAYVLKNKNENYSN